jgi:hypothetical protein
MVGQLPCAACAFGVDAVVSAVISALLTAGGRRQRTLRRLGYEKPILVPTMGREDFGTGVDSWVLGRFGGAGVA